MVDKIFLNGYMGAGKSSVGKVLAEFLNYQFIDTDAMIEEEASMSISSLFSREGEAFFRNLEGNVLSKIDEFNDNMVISTGGGLPCYNNLMDKMNQMGVTIYLKASINTLVDRISMDQNRPLVAGKSRNQLKNYVTKHLRKRKTIYVQSQYVVLVKGSPEEIALRIIDKIS